MKINTRYLLTRKARSTKITSRPEEHFIVEIADSGKFFKSRQDDKLSWKNTDDYEILEELRANT